MCVVCYVCVCMCRHVHMCIEARGQCQVSSMIAFHPISLDKVLLNLEFIAFLGLAHLVLGICMSAPIQHWIKDSHKGPSLLGRSPWSELRYSWLWGSTSSNRAIFQVLQEIILNSTYAVVIFLTWQVSGYNLFENVTKNAMSVSSDDQSKAHNEKASRGRNTNIWAYSLYTLLLLKISGYGLEELSAKTPIIQA